ncbi:zinc finger and BTB domain-containing protein 37 isoform X2 [Mastacembelus armatus]|uniref:zinc finger and BTB domain-containing protein 37 isoform X2 n=1 Tax=Mastacembelus armatus TaxID=205130 RepID=UPI000E4655E4|nr:zinc finger and BTB domain-containing protein 37 isoform X2 [Mastacembelus armatus]
MERSGSIQLDIPDFSNSVLSHLNQLRVQGRLCDIVVNVQGQSFRAHKVVLAASSPYFRDHMSLGQMSTVSLTVIRNPSVFEQLLSFCYTGRLCLQLADIISYLTAASFLQMQHIIDRCTQILEGIHLKISLADLDEEPREETARGSRGSRTLEAVVRGGSHHGSLRLLGPRGSSEVCEAVSPAEETLSPPPTVEHSGLEGPGAAASRAGKEPILRINRAGQWYVETSSEPERTGSAEEVVAVDGVRIKTERMEEWIGAGEHPEEGGPVEEGATVMIDTSGRSTVVTGPVLALGTRSVQPSSSFSETDRFSPTGSVVVLAERQRAKSESPNRADELRQPSSQGEEHTAFDMGGYEDYLREQSCESDSQWTVTFYASGASGSVLPDRTAAALTLQAKSGTIRYTDSSHIP